MLAYVRNRPQRHMRQRVCVEVAVCQEYTVLLWKLLLSGVKVLTSARKLHRLQITDICRYINDDGCPD